MDHTDTIRIEASSDRVWEVMSHVERWHEWTDSITSVRLDRPLAIGAKATVRQPRLPTAQWTVTALESGRSFTWESDAPGIHSTGIHSVTPNDDGTSTAELRIVQTGWFARIMTPLYGGMTRRYVRMEAEGLKARSEGLPAGSEGER